MFKRDCLVQCWARNWETVSWVAEWSWASYSVSVLGRRQWQTPSENLCQENFRDYWYSRQSPGTAPRFDQIKCSTLSVLVADNGMVLGMDPTSTLTFSKISLNGNKCFFINFNGISSDSKYFKFPVKPEQQICSYMCEWQREKEPASS